MRDVLMFRKIFFLIKTKTITAVSLFWPDKLVLKLVYSN